jgi:Mrp family chromosome partitioning ATPase
MSDYISTQLAWKTQSASTTEDFVSNQLKNVSASLAAADQALAAYQAQTGVIAVPQNAQTIINELATYEQQRETLQMQRAALQQLANGFEQSKGNLNPYLVNQADNTVPSDLINSLSTEELKLSELRATFTDATHDVQVEEAKVAEIQAAIRDTVRNDLAAADTNLKNLNQTIGTLQDQLKLMPAESLKIISLQRSSDVLGQLYVLLMKKQQEAQLSKAATIINTRIVTPSDMPLGATTPKLTVTVLFGALVGLVAGIALAFGQRAFSGRFESEDQIRLAVRLPVYGAIPRRAKKEISNGVFNAIGQGPFFESFRLLRATITRLGVPGEPMVILIISAAKSDGKTTVATNLAKSLADNGKQVILVDGDLHLSRLRSLRSEPTLGLSDWIKTGVKPEIENWPGENFRLLSAGSARFSDREQLNEDRLAPIFADLRNGADYVIIDSPPLPTVSDGLLLGAFADLVLSVVSVSHTPRRSFNIHNELIETLNCPHGIIINEVDPEYYGADAYFMDEAPGPRKYVGLFKLGKG